MIPCTIEIGKFNTIETMNLVSDQPHCMQPILNEPNPLSNREQANNWITNIQNRWMKHHIQFACRTDHEP